MFLFFSLKLPEHVEEAIPRLCHAVVVHLDGNQDGVFIGNFKRWEGRSVCEAQQPAVGTVCKRRHLNAAGRRKAVGKIRSF